MKLLFVQWNKYFFLLLIIHHERSSVSTRKISTSVPSLSAANERLARNNKPYIPLNSLTFQTALNDGSTSWTHQGPSLLKQMLKRSKLGGNFKENIGLHSSDSVQETKASFEQEMQGSNGENLFVKENGAVSVLIGQDKSIINVLDNNLKKRVQLETRKIDGNRPKIISKATNESVNISSTASHDNYPFKKPIYPSVAEQNVKGNLSLTNNNGTKLEEKSFSNSSKPGDETSGVFSRKKTFFNRRFIPTANKVKLAELEKTKPSKSNPESNIIWIFTTPEHMYTLSETTDPTPMDNDAINITTEMPDSSFTESEQSFTERVAEVSNSVFNTVYENLISESDSLLSTLSPNNENAQEEVNMEESASAQQMITSDASVNQHPLTTDSATTTIANINSTWLQNNELSSLSDLRSTTKKSSNEFLSPPPVSQFTQTYPVSTKKEMEKMSTLSTSSPFLGGSTQNIINKSQESENKDINYQSSTFGKDNFDSVTSTPVSSIATTKLLSPTTVIDSEGADYTSSYPTELDILKEIKKVFQSLSNDINLQTGVAINKDSNEITQGYNSYFDNLFGDSYTKSPEKNPTFSTESYSHVSKSTTDNSVQTQTEENLDSVVDSLLGNLKKDNRTVINKLNPPYIIINESKPNQIIEVSYVNNTTPSTYLTNYDNPYSQYTPLVQLNVWNYLNGHLQLTETQAVPSPTIDIINSPEVSINNEQKQSLLLFPQSTPNSVSINNKVLDEKEWLSHHNTITTESNKLITSSVTQLEVELKPSVDPFDFINILSYLEEQITSPSTTTETVDVIPENLYEFVMNHNNKKGSTSTRDYVRDKLETIEAVPIKEDLKVFNYKVPIKASSTVLHSPSKKLLIPTTEKAIASNYIEKDSNKSNETHFTVSTTPAYVFQSNINLPILNYSKRPSSPQRNGVTLPNKEVAESSGGIFNNTYLPSFLQIYQQQNNQNPQLVTNQLNTQQFITINNHPLSQNNNSASNGYIGNETKNKTVTKATPLTKNNNIKNDASKLSSSSLSTKGSSSPASLSSDDSISVLLDSEYVPSLNEGYPRPNTLEQVNNSSSGVKDPLLNIDSATLVKEYIKRISVISQFFRQYDVTNPETASMIENLALKSLLSYILGEEDILAHELNKKVVTNEPSTPKPSNSNKNENPQSSFTEAEYEISIISKLVFDAVLQDGDDQNPVSQLSLLQNSNSFDDINKNPITEIEEPLVVHNHEADRPLLPVIEDQNSTKQEDSYFDSLTFDWLSTTNLPEIDEPLLGEELDEQPTIVDNIKNSVTGITGMISNLVPSGSTFQDCLNKLSCSFALASSLAIGATGVLAIPMLLPFGRKKKQVLFEESRIFGQPIHEHDGSLITDQKLKSEFKRVLTYLSHPDEHKSDKRINEMKGNLIKYLKEEYDKIQKDRKKIERPEIKKQSHEYKVQQTKYRKPPAKNNKNS